MRRCLEVFDGVKVVSPSVLSVPSALPMRQSVQVLTSGSGLIRRELLRRATVLFKTTYFIRGY